MINMRGVLLEPPVTRWECVACKATDTTRQAGHHTRMHSCAHAGGMTVPMVVAGTKGKLVMHEREDYVGGEDVQAADDGTVYMSAEIVRDEGTDLAVYASTAYADGYGGDAR